MVLSYPPRRSLVEHLLGGIFKLAATVHVTDLLLCCGGGPVGGCVLGRRLLLSLGVLVDDHALGSNGILLGRGSEALVTATFCSGALLVLLHARLLADDVQHRVFERLFVLGEPVLLPGVVEDTWVEIVAGHAALEVVQGLPVVGFLLELERPAVFHVLTELRGVASAELLEARLDLLFLDIVVLLVLGASGKTLPGELAFDKVEQDVADGFKIVSPRLLDTLVRGDGSVTRRARQILAVLVRDVLSIGVLVALGQSEINDVDVIACSIRPSNQEVVRLDITMDDALFVHFFNASDQLHRNHEDGLEIEVALARLEEIFKGGAKEVHDHNVELLVGHRAVRTDVVEAGHAGFSMKNENLINVSNRATYSCHASCGSVLTPRRASGCADFSTLSPTLHRARTSG